MSHVVKSRSPVNVLSPLPVISIKHYLNVKFPPLLWKALVFDCITVDGIQAIDLQSFTLINEMEKQIEQAKLIDTNSTASYVFDSILSELRFDVVSAAEQTFELVPGGNHISITAKNFKEYCFHYRQYRLNEFHRQIKYIRQGLHSVVPCYFLNLFTATELEEAVCGKGQIDVELLKRNTKYAHGYDQDSPMIERFWTVMSEMFNEEQKKMLLVFAWGRSTLPVRDEDFTSKFIIHKWNVSSGNDDQALPQSHTCNFTIDLLEYSTTEIMYERLNYAITYCSSIDGDGHMNEEHVDLDDDSGDSD